jgi:hypothetical protein
MATDQAHVTGHILGMGTEPGLAEKGWRPGISLITPRTVPTGTDLVELFDERSLRIESRVHRRPPPFTDGTLEHPGQFSQPRPVTTKTALQLTRGARAISRYDCGSPPTSDPRRKGIVVRLSVPAAEYPGEHPFVVAQDAARPPSIAQIVDPIQDLGDLRPAIDQITEQDEFIVSLGND